MVLILSPEHVHNNNILK